MHSINRSMSHAEVQSLSPLCLAFLGDSVFDLLVRTQVLSDVGVDRLHQRAKAMVNAKAQSQFFSVLEPVLTETELQVFKRGRNAKSHSSAKNAAIIEYRRATAVEALFGYLYATGQEQRINELFGLCMSYTP